ncbi:MAG TPA: hypothetical protein PLS12_02235 [Bacteroidales bacterium]|nr:hypothetical protein [Bacteroidales bacterium]
MITQEYNIRFLYFLCSRIIQSVATVCIITAFSFAQGEIDDEKKVLYRNELTGSFGIHTNGIGIGMRYADHVYRLKKTVYEAQLMTIHHPKEIKLSSPTGRMVYGKLNNIYAFTLSLGNHNEKYSKLDKSSVAISFVYDAGLSLAIEKPVYYYIKYPNVIERFNTSNHTKYGKAPFVYGLNELQYIPGIFAKSCLQFEFSKTDSDVRSLEFGMQIHAYMRKLQIMYSDENTWVYPMLFINYRLGKVVKH